MTCSAGGYRVSDEAPEQRGQRTHRGGDECGGQRLPGCVRHDRREQHDDDGDPGDAHRVRDDVVEQSDRRRREHLVREAEIEEKSLAAFAPAGIPEERDGDGDVGKADDIVQAEPFAADLLLGQQAGHPENHVGDDELDGPDSRGDETDDAEPLGRLAQKIFGQTSPPDRRAKRCGRGPDFGFEESWICHGVASQAIPESTSALASRPV